ncbi:MAG: ATP-grasp domain-containing protein [Methylococcaceae bacterium]|nr:ATP-grasp domain-containing protein [Methylococcaceae bacterium]
MKVLIFEYITGGGMRRETVSPSLAQEGELMLRALVDDLLAVPASHCALSSGDDTDEEQSAAIELRVLRDDRFPLPKKQRMHVVDIGEQDETEAVWRDWVGRCDAVWPIAPETDGILERLCWDVEAAGIPLLNSGADAVRLAASKLQTARRLAESGLPVVPTFELKAWPAVGQPPFVVKPDDGVGCEGIRVIGAPAAFSLPAKAEGWIAQPFLDGIPLSLSALFARGRSRLLSCNRQWVEQRGDGFILCGCRVNATADEGGRWQRLADGVARALPQLWGYVGIDLLLVESEPQILEINPRLTSSYAGLREATGENPAAQILQLWKTGELPPPRIGRGKPVEIRWRERP